MLFFWGFLLLLVVCYLWSFPNKKLNVPVEVIQ